MSQWIRVIFNDNGTKTDYSLDSADEGATVTLPVIAAEDSLIIGQSFPFNNFLVETSTVNTSSSNLTVSYWTGSGWTTAVDLLDGSKSSGRTFGRTGVVQFSPDRNSAWTMVTDTSDSSAPSELQGFEIYDMYWAKLTFSANFLISTAIKSISYAFTTDDILDSLDPEIERYQSSWETNKTSWVEQIKVASQMVVYDLKARGVVFNNGQIIKLEDFAIPTAFRTLMNIYGILGPSHEDRLKWASENYFKLMNQKNFSVDANGDGLKSRSEDVGFAVRGIR